ncbi:MAG: hypothetical protein U0325_03690 [Polyangiales bacterium]
MVCVVSLPAASCVRTCTSKGALPLGQVTSTQASVMVLDGTVVQPLGSSGEPPMTLAHRRCPAASLRAHTLNWLPATMVFTSPERPMTLIAMGRCTSTVGPCESTVHVTSALVPALLFRATQVARARNTPSGVRATLRKRAVPPLAIATRGSVRPVSARRTG